MFQSILHRKVLLPILVIVTVIGFSACSESEKVDSEPTRWDRFVAIFDFSNVERDTAKYSLRLEKFENVLGLANGIDLTFYDSLLKANGGSIDWDGSNNLKGLIYKPKAIDRNPNFEVFGWHPFWLGTAFESYNFELLNYISWFSYDVDANTGAPSNPAVIEELNTTGLEMIKLAQAKDCKVLLTITNHGREKTRKFLANNAAQQTVLIDSVLSMVQTLKLDGLDINFENVHPGSRREMNAFVRKISNKLKSVDKNYILSLTIPKDSRSIANVGDLNSVVDIFVVTGYDFHTRGSSRDGPIAPLDGFDGRIDIKDVVDNYLQKGVNEKQLLLGLPYYGGVWSSSNPVLRSPDRTFKRHLSYRAIMSIYGKEPPKYDRLSESAYYIRQTDSSEYEKVWFDDSLTLEIKFRWAEEKGLGGIGIWSLGYDNGRTELWRAIDKVVERDTVLAPMPIATNERFNVAVWLADYQIPIMITLLFYAVFVGLGFFISLFDWRVRNYLFENKSSRLIFILSIFGFVTFIYLTILFFEDESIFTGQTNLLIIGMLIGGLIAGVVMWWYERHRSRLP